MKQFDAVLTKQRMEQHIQKRLDEKILAGVVAGVWVNGKQAVDVCLGSRDPEKGIAISRETLFRMASMTKPVTGAATMLQVQRGKLELDTPISKWIPAFEKMEVAYSTPEGKILATRPANKQITPRMLLTHSSGLGTGASSVSQWNEFKPKDGQSLQSAVNGYARSLLDFQPGESQLYSACWGMDTLAALVELSADMPYKDFIRKEIFEPLDMVDTTYDPTPAQQAREMAFVDARDGKLVPIQVSAVNGFHVTAAGFPGGGAGLFSTLEDYSHFALMYLNNGTYNGYELLKKETVDQMATPQLPEHFPGMWRYTNWGLSMRVCPEQKAPDQPLTPGTLGWSGAYGTHFWVDRAKNTVGVYMSNLTDGGGAGAPTAFEFERDVMAGYGECE